MMYKRRGTSSGGNQNQQQDIISPRQQQMKDNQPPIQEQTKRRTKIRLSKALEIFTIKELIRRTSELRHCVCFSCGECVEFLVFIAYWIQFNIQDPFLWALFTVWQNITVLISLTLYLTLLAVLMGGISGIVGAAAKKPAAVFISAICHLEIFLGLLEFGLIGSIHPTNRLDQAAIAHLEATISTFSENDTDNADHQLWATTQIKFQCCGVNSRQVWRDDNPVFTRSKKEDSQMFPISCCKDLFQTSPVPLSNIQLKEQLNKYYKALQQEHRARSKRSALIASTTPLIPAFITSTSKPATVPSSASLYGTDRPVCLRKYTVEESDLHFFQPGCKEPFLNWYKKEMDYIFEDLFILSFVHLVLFGPSMALFILYNKNYDEDDEDYI
ncbi:uncharacterized protein LOC142338383 isoform X2 [Convolutriloba macropyga]|uniref:uncharacterized protein LOC142338383 isoform X2 n=1 Tax=Convolutriloba macropyga TaxID=536237 RepID=UPI003F51F291